MLYCKPHHDADTSGFIHKQQQLAYLLIVDVKNINLQIKTLKNMFFTFFIKTFLKTCITNIKTAKKHKNTCF